MATIPHGLVSTNETIIFKKENNAFQFSEHVSMFQPSSSALWIYSKDLQNSRYV